MYEIDVQEGNYVIVKYTPGTHQSGKNWLGQTKPVSHSQANVYIYESESDYKISEANDINLYQFYAAKNKFR